MKFEKIAEYGHGAVERIAIYRAGHERIVLLHIGNGLPAAKISLAAENFVAWRRAVERHGWEVRHAA